MSILSNAFAAFLPTIHWGPAGEPFYRAIIAEHDALEARVAELEAERASDKIMMDVLRDEFKTMCTAREQSASPKYIEEPALAVPVAQAAVDALTGHVADDADSLAESGDEQNPAEPVQTPISGLLAAQPEPAPAGPDDEAAAMLFADDVPAAADAPAQDPVTE